MVSRLIDNYCGIANNKNMDGEKSDNDIALTIGQICIDNSGAAEDLKSVLTKDNCRSGMMEYLKLYDGGKLPSLAGKIGDGGQYINQLQYKFSSDAANWVWNTDTVNAKIDELICEYELLCDNSVMDAIIDRFGPDVQTYAGDLQNFRVIEEIAVGKVFFNWIFGFEGKVRIKGPESVKKQYREMVMSAMNLV